MDPSARRAFRAMAKAPITAASAASASHIWSQAARVGCIAARPAIASAVTPMATPPHPGTAVNDVARSIVSRMKERLSIARSCSAGDGVLGDRNCGLGDARVPRGTGSRQLLCSIK